MSVRTIRRVLALAFVLVLFIPRLWLYRLRGPLTLERRALEALALEEYRSGHLTEAELQKLLGFAM